MNVSPTQLVQPDFIDVVDVALHGAGLEPRHLELEVTEGITMHDIDTVRRRLFELRDLGVRIALDDFGLGYSSIGTLRSLPLDRLKVDKSLVGPGDGDPITPEEQRAVLAAITTMAQTFGLQVTVEGIETDTQLEMAIDVGCDDVQGYLFGPPLPAERVVGFLADWRPHLPSVAATPRAGSSGVERPRPRRRAQGGP